MMEQTKKLLVLFFSFRWLFLQLFFFCFQAQKVDEGAIKKPLSLWERKRKKGPNNFEKKLRFLLLLLSLFPVSTVTRINGSLLEKTFRSCGRLSPIRKRSKSFFYRSEGREPHQRHRCVVVLIRAEKAFFIIFDLLGLKFLFCWVKQWYKRDQLSGPTRRTKCKHGFRAVNCILKRLHEKKKTQRERRQRRNGRGTNKKFRTCAGNIRNTTTKTTRRAGRDYGDEEEGILFSTLYPLLNSCIVLPPTDDKKCLECFCSAGTYCLIVCFSFRLNRLR